MLKKGKRILTRRLVIRDSCSVGTISPGTKIEITQVDLKNKKVLICNSWVNNDLVKSISKEL